jgi:hypothetical protein
LKNGGNGFVLFFYHEALEEHEDNKEVLMPDCSLCLLPFCRFSFSPTAWLRQTVPHFSPSGRDLSPVPFLIIRTYAERVKGNSKIREKILDGINRIYRINELKNSRTPEPKDSRSGILLSLICFTMKCRKKTRL